MTQEIEVIQPQMAEEEGLPLGRYYIEKGKSYYAFVRGVTVQIEQVSPTLILEVQATLPEPMAPVRTFDRGDGEMITEVNKADPLYQAQYQRWQLDIEAAYAQLIIKLGIKITPDMEEVNKVRSLMKSLFKVDLDPDDTFVYVKYCLPSNEQEYNHFLGCAVGRSRPDKGAVAKALENFSDNLQKTPLALRINGGAG